MLVVNTKFFGLCSYATAGKDYFFSLLQEKLGEDKVFRFSFAKSLKEELYPIVKDKFNLDVFNCSIEEKKIIRPLFVSWAAIHRFQTNGKYYINKLSEQLTKELITGKYQNKIICFTDLRFYEWPYDEVHWIKDLYGKIVHIDKYIVKKDEYSSGYSNVKVFIEPPNKEEEVNCKKIKEIADYKIEWPHGDKEFAGKEIDKFIEYYKLCPK